MATIDKATPAAAVGLAAVLSGANPKNLLLAVGGAAAIAQTGISGGDQAIAYVVFALRGARTRDARNFARYLDETLQRWGDEAEVHWGPHTWPVWGNENITAFIESQRGTYKYIHDQALRLAPASKKRRVSA
jgi:hypothetical protein